VVLTMVKLHVHCRYVVANSGWMFDADQYAAASAVIPSACRVVSIGQKAGTVFGRARWVSA